LTRWLAVRLSCRPILALLTLFVVLAAPEGDHVGGEEASAQLRIKKVDFAQKLLECRGDVVNKGFQGISWSVRAAERRKERQLSSLTAQSAEMKAAKLSRQW
jgi:hypothetical protein